MDASKKEENWKDFDIRHLRDIVEEQEKDQSNCSCESKVEDKRQIDAGRNLAVILFAFFLSLGSFVLTSHVY